MKKTKLRILLTYASIFFVIICLFSMSIFMFVSHNQMKKVDTDLQLFKNAILRVYDNDLHVALPLNPKTITIVRKEDGKLDMRFPVSEFYEEALKMFEAFPLDEVKTVAYKGGHYRTTRFQLMLGEELRDVQVLYNIDSDIRVLNSLKSILVNGSILIIFASIMISYVLANRTIKPMKESIEKERAFLQDASHELKSPLMSIQGYAEGVRDGVFHGAEADSALEVIVRETGRLKKLVEELVYLGKLESASEVYNFEDTELSEVLEQAVEAQQVLALDKNIMLVVGNCPEARLWADGEKLVRVFVNLIANAVRHAACRVFVQAAVQGEMLQVTVQDDGPGFTDEDLRRLWERFYKGPRGGSGLGLPIARAIVEEHGGTIRAGNASDGGAEIVVMLPGVNN